MSYISTNWIDGETPVNAENLNKLESGVYANSEAIGEINTARENGEFKGQDGITPVVTVTNGKEADGRGNATIEVKYTFDGIVNTQSATITDGRDGFTPIKGVDYFTEADKSELVQLVLTELGGSPVYGYVDADNNVVVRGGLADGIYTVKYEMEDGSTVDIGELVLGTVEPEEPAYINQIPLSTEADGTPFNGGKGFKEGYRVNSSGAEEARTGSSVVGFIPFTINDTVYIKGISTTNNRYFVVYDANHAKIYAWDISAIATLDGSLVAFDIKKKANDVLAADQQNAIAYFRMCADSIDDNSIITINQPIE